MVRRPCARQVTWINFAGNTLGKAKLGSSLSRCTSNIAIRVQFLFENSFFVPLRGAVLNCDSSAVLPEKVHLVKHVATLLPWQTAFSANSAARQSLPRSGYTVPEDTRRVAWACMRLALFVASHPFLPASHLSGFATFQCH